MSLAPVHRFAQVRRFFEACRARRADIALVGDSNIYSAGTSGLAVGFQAAWGRRFGQYATGVHPTAAQGGFTLDYKAAFNTFLTPVADPATVPASHRPYVVDGGWGDAPFYAATLASNTFNNAFAILDPAHPNGVAGNLRLHYDYGTFAAAGAGQFQPCVRYEGLVFPTAYAIIGAPVSVNTGTDALVRGHLDLPAGARSSGSKLFGQFQIHDAIGFGPTATDLGTVTAVRAGGPFFSAWSRWEWRDVPVGVATSVLCYQGGRGTRDHALLCQAITNQQFAPWAAMVTGPQEDRPVLLLHVVSGQNDGDGLGGGSTALSVGPHPAASNTPAGVADNTAALVNAVRARWVAAGFDVDDLYVMVGPYHPQEYSRRRWGRDLDAALAAYADGERNVAVAARSRLSTSAYFSAKGWYVDAYPSDAHLSAQGYHDWAELATNGIVPAPAVVLRHATGASLDLLVFDECGQVFDRTGRAFGPWADARLGDYVIPGVEQGTSGVYRFTLPPSLPPRPAVLRGLVTERSGADPAAGDASVAAVDAGTFDGLRTASAMSAAEDAADDRLVDRRRLAYLDVPVSRAGNGGGAVAVDHDTGGADALRYVDGGGAGVGGATVRAYVSADYVAGAYVDRGRTATKSDGRWAAPLYLDPGVPYTLTFAKPGAYQLSKREVTV